MRVWVISGSIATIGAAGVIAGDLIPYHRRAIVRCQLPAYNYVRVAPSNPASTESLQGIVLERAFPPDPMTGNTPPALHVRYWQLRDAEVHLRHCSIARGAVWVDESTGEWRVSFQATQNPYAGIDRQAMPEARFLRNKFYVKVRGLGGKPLGNDAGAILGSPETFCVSVPPFWIDRGESRNVSFQGTLSKAETGRIPMTDRVVIDFSWE